MLLVKKKHGPKTPELEGDMEAPVSHPVDDKYHISVSDETAVLLRKDCFRSPPAAPSGVDGEAWRDKMLQRGQQKHGGTKLVEEWKTTLARTCVVRAHLIKGTTRPTTSSATSLRPERWSADDPKPQKGEETCSVILCAVHGKGGSDVTDTFIPELSAVLGEDIKDVGAFVVGMDSNTSDAERFRQELLVRGIMATEAVDAGAATRVLSWAFSTREESKKPDHVERGVESDAVSARDPLEER